MQKIPFPTDIDLALTGKCNLRCKHCNTADTWNIENELKLNEIFWVFDQLKQAKIFRLSFFGGEPFYHPNILEILERLNQYPFRVTFLTNATLINELIAAALRKLKFLENIQISLDGSCASIHDWQRGKGSFAKTVRAIKLLKQNKLPFSLKAVINTHNYQDIEGMVLFAKSLGLSAMDFGDAVECGSAFKHKDEFRLDGAIYKEALSAILRLKKENPDFSFGGTLAQSIEMLKSFYKNGPNKGERGNFNVCGAGHSLLSIRSDAEVVPCSAFWTLKCGNLRDMSLEEIWEKSPVLESLRALKDVSLSQFDNCRKCDYLSYCNGGCRAAAYYASGNNLKGLNPKTCIVFSNWAGQRLGPDYFKEGALSR